MTLPLNRFRESVDDAPSASQSAIEYGAIDVDRARPVRQAKRRAIKSQALITPSVSCLVVLTSPYAIFWRIAELVIDAFQRISIRTWSHVRNERGEVQPSVAHGYASGSIVAIAGVSRVATALLHRVPYGILASHVTVSRASVLSHLGVMAASATGCVFAGQVSGWHERHRSAFAAALPDNGTAALGAIRCGADDGEVANDKPCQVAARSHLSFMCSSIIRLTSSAMEMPSRLASRIRNFRCGSVNEIICLIIDLPASVADVLGVRVEHPSSLQHARMSGAEPESDIYTDGMHRDKFAVVAQRATIHADGSTAWTLQAGCIEDVPTVWPSKNVLPRALALKKLAMACFAVSVTHAYMIPQGIQTVTA